MTIGRDIKSMFEHIIRPWNGSEKHKETYLFQKQRHNLLLN